MLNGFFLLNMNKKIGSMKNFVISAFAFFFFLMGANSALAQNETNVYFFWGDGCPHCEDQKPFLQDLKAKYPDLNIREYETWKNKDNAALFQKIAKAYGVQARGVPATFIGDFAPIFGFNVGIKTTIEENIKYCLVNKCPDPGVKGGIVEASEVLAQPETTKTEVPIKNQELTQSESTSASEIEAEQNAVVDKRGALCLHLFGRTGCLQCASVEMLLLEMEEKYDVNINKYDIDIPENAEIYKSFKEKYGLTTASHPIIFMGERYLIGERAIKENLENEIMRCQEAPCVCPLGNIKAVTPFMPKSSEVTPEKSSLITLPLIGQVDFSAMPIVVITSIIAFVDGFNPCSLWLITFLLGIVIYSGSRKKILLIGGTFLIVTGLAYGFFMVGLLNVFLYIGYIKWIQITVALIALIFAVVNIKDYFWYKRGISFTISDKYKPKIFKDVRGLMKDNKSTWALVVGTTVMALGVVLVELPCTAGFPVVWTNMIAQKGIEGLTFVGLLFLYMFIYLLDEVVVIGLAALTLKAGHFEEKHGRILKLIGGMIMLALALVMIFDPKIMNSVLSSIAVFCFALLASFLILFIHRKVLPKFNISIGSEQIVEDKTEENKND
jgi:thiol-disulfide isomerase/thioredoxin